MKIKTLRTWLGLLVLSAGLASCGGTTGDTTTQIRLLNASPDLATANLYTDGDQRASGIAPDSISGYSEFDPDSYTVKLTNSIGVTLTSVNQDLAKDTRYTAVAWGRSGSIGLAMLTESDKDTDDIDSGWGRLRVFNGAAKEAGSLDIYLVPLSTGAIDLTSFTPAVAATASTLTAYSDLLAGTYRLIATAANDPTDIRLDLPSFTLGNQQLISIVLEPSAGGVLVHALLLSHQGALTVGKNQSARVRLVASVANGAGAVKAGVNGVIVSGASMTAPQIGIYTLVPAGGAAPGIMVGTTGVAPDPSVPTFDAGGDYTVLVAGPASALVSKTIVDDNRLPTNAAKAKIRLIDGVVGAGPASLTVTSVAAGSVTPPDGSAYTLINPASPASVNVTAGATTLFSTDTTSTTAAASVISAGGVYTVFILDGAVDSAKVPVVTGRLYLERSANATTTTPTTTTTDGTTTQN